jgi:hypothetical protein
MQNTMGQDLINKSFSKVGLVPRNANIRNLINDSYYFGYKWKDRLNNLTNYTHYRSMYKLIISENSYVLEKITTYVVIQHFKIVSIDVYMCNRIPNELELTSDYQDNIGIVEQYMLNEANKHKISKYNFKILENESIFSVMDSNYGIIKHDGILESSNADGYNKSSVSISSLLENFIVPR